MKKYDVYGMGNALVDVEIEVPEEFLSRFNIEKGVMTLVDHSRQEELLKQSHGKIHKKACGGSAANTIIALSQFGGRGFYSCRVGNDEWGKFYAQDLKDHKVDSPPLGNPGAGTGRCIVFITPDTSRTMNTFLGISAEFGEEDLDLSALKNSSYLYTEGYLLMSPTGKKAAFRAKDTALANDVKVALTLSDPGVVNHFKKEFESFLAPGGIDLLFCNEQEVLTLSGRNTLEESFSDAQTFAKTVVITRGEKGAVILTDGQTLFIETKKIVPVDSNGAGDLFAGAYLFGITQNYSPHQAGNLACLAATSLVTQFGPRLKQQDIDQLMQI